MEQTNVLTDTIPPMKKGQLNIYKPSDVKRWGTGRFLETTAAKEPFLLQFPAFSQEENRRMDDLMVEGDQGAV